MKKALVLALLLAGCATPGKQAPKPEASQVDEMRGVANTLLTRLGGKLKAAVTADGPAAAIGVCKEAAPKIAAELSQQTGWQVARVGTRVRNIGLGTPDVWERHALETFADRLAAGEKPDSMELAEVVQEPSGPHLRYAKALLVKPMCVACHGTPDEIPPAVMARLKADYPNDQAIGYSVGELRGAVVIDRPL